MNDWSARVLSDVIDLQRGHDLPAQYRLPGSVPIIGSFGITGYHNTAKYEGPGVAIGRSGVIGGATYVNEPYWPLNTSLFVKDFKNNDPLWVYYLLKSIDFTGFNSGSAQPSLNRNYLRDIPVLVPCKLEQRSIAQVLEALDGKVAANSKLASTSEQLLSAEVHRGWLGNSAVRTVSILDLFDVGPSLPAPVGANPVYLAMKNLPEEGVGVDYWEHRSARGGARFTNGDTLLARITPCLENRKTGYVDFLEDGEIGIGSTEFIVLRSLEGIPSPLSYFVAVDPHFRDFAIRHMVGTSGRQRVSASDISNYLLPAPDLGWMKSFGPLATKQFDLMRSLRGESRTLSRLRDTLLPELMSGRLRVKDAEKKIEEVV